jgi:hypothetical protein
MKHACSSNAYRCKQDCPARTCHKLFRQAPSELWSLHGAPSGLDYARIQYAWTALSIKTHSIHRTFFGPPPPVLSSPLFLSHRSRTVNCGTSLSLSRLCLHHLRHQHPASLAQPFWNCMHARARASPVSSGTVNYCQRISYPPSILDDNGLLLGSGRLRITRRRRASASSHLFQRSLVGRRASCGLYLLFRIRRSLRHRLPRGGGTEERTRREEEGGGSTSGHMRGGHEDLGFRCMRGRATSTSRRHTRRSSSRSCCAFARAHTHTQTHTHAHTRTTHTHTHTHGCQDCDN